MAGEAVGAANLHIGDRFLPGSVVETEDAEEFETALDVAGSKTVRVVVLGKRRRGDSWSVLEVLWEEQVRWKQTPQGRKLDLRKWPPSQKTINDIGRSHGVRFVKAAVRSRI